MRPSSPNRARLFERRTPANAALVVEAGGHPKCLQEMMGHASIRTTMDDYGGLFETTNRDAA